MATKTEIETLQNSNLASGTLIPATKHRQVLNTDDASILENIYPTPIRDQSSGTKTVTESNANFSYGVTITKTGRKVHLNGVFVALSNRSAFSVVFGIILPEYDCDNQVYFANAKKVGADTILISITSSQNLIIRQNIITGETFYFDITYNTLN